MDLGLKTRLEKFATDEGFSVCHGLHGDWIVFEAHALPSRLALTQSTDGAFCVATSNTAVGLELRAEGLTEGEPLNGFHSFTATNSTDLVRLIRRIWALAKSLPDEPLLEFRKQLAQPATSTEVERIRKERVGQDVFRKALLQFWDDGCAVTGVQNRTLLRASHIKPWADCSTDEERLDPYNGLLLVANLDAAFDGGLITFDDHGKIQISSALTSSDQEKLGIDARLALRKISPQHEQNLLYHQTHIFQR